MHTKTLWIKDDFLQLILDGRKSIEVRVAYSNISRLQPGDQLLLNERYPYTIKRIGRYEDFAAMLEAEDAASIAPDMAADELLAHIRAIYPPEKEELGVVALEIAPAAVLHVRITYAYEPEAITDLEKQLLPGIMVSVGDDTEGNLDYHVLVSGRIEERHLTASPNLHTVIVPWVGINAATRELLSGYPHIALHNLHHNAIPVTETAVALMLAAAKVVIPFDQKLRDNDWRMRYIRPSPALLLHGKTVLILGYGAIGRHIAAVCKALGMRVLAIKRTVQQPAEGTADEIHPLEKLPELLAEANVLMICLPLTEETEHLIGARELALLPPQSILVNVGRGPVVDQGALYAALRDRQLHSAGLDVWYNYPQDKEARGQTAPADYPFHELENVVMSPHRGGSTQEIDRLRMARLAILINKILRGEPVPNRVNLQLGY
jgi:phosphoglycerate dehydrogenase-like enzyme/ASC-1-like (ASCH) protein